MTIFHATDLHFNKEWFNWIASQQPYYDLFCLTGDFLEETRPQSLQEQIEWVSSWMREFQKPLFVCSGNHDIEELDNENWLCKIPNVYSDGTIKTVDGVKFGCMPFMVIDYFDYDECDVLLYHVPPAKTKTALHRKTGEDWGDSQLTQMLENKVLSPKYLLCGHLHYPTTNTDTIKSTLIVNPGMHDRQKSCRFEKIKINT